jgi:3-dehydroquinate dehydratase/shikimate dehydrogenase
VKAHSEKYFLTGICMGEKGQLTRIMGPVVGSALNYVSENNKGTTAPGQLTCDESRKTYHYARLNKKTRIYALVGNPVHLSAGHILHNQAIQCLKQNAVYIKLCVEKENLAKIKAYCQQLAFYGFSITMPLKETILSLVDTIEKDSQTIHAVNSITCRRKKWYGFNTDGIGAIQALTEKINIENQLIVILGAGGAARAITYEALKRKAKVLILNRTYSRARQLADTLGCQAAKIERLKDIRSTACKVIINTLPQKAYTEKFMQDLLQPDYLAADLWMMDIVYRPSFTYFIKTAKAAGCRYIFGHDMYIYQALLQIKNWFDATEDQLNTIKSKMRYYFQ